VAKRGDVMADPWLIAQASVVGTGHVKSGLPCQDASVARVTDSGEWLVVVVSDGAGTAKRSDEGAELVATHFFESLLSLSRQFERRAPGQWVNDFVIARVLEARESLRQKAQADVISDFHCTLVACLLGPSGGFAIHLGDGAIFGGCSDQSRLNTTGNFFISYPENGEYANETFFITEGDWVRHLRITPMPPMDWIYACTDGGTAFALEGDKEPREGFIFPVLNKVLQQSTQTKRNEALIAILTDSLADKVTADDKTIVLACRSSKLDSQHPLRLKKKSEIKNNSLGSRAPEIVGGASLQKSKNLNPKAIPIKNSSRWRLILKIVAIFFILGLLGFVTYRFGNNILNAIKGNKTEVTPPGITKDQVEQVVPQVQSGQDGKNASEDDSNNKKDGDKFPPPSPASSGGTDGANSAKNQSTSESAKPNPPKKSSNSAEKGAGSSAAGVNIQGTNPPSPGTTTR
jgi:hypothetical protein